MPFGKYYGRKMSDVPSSYFEELYSIWDDMVLTTTDQQQVFAYIMDYIK